MKKFIALSLLCTFGMIGSVSATEKYEQIKGDLTVPTTAVDPLLPQRPIDLPVSMFGVIKSVTDTQLLVESKESGGLENSILLNITDETLIIDGETGMKMELKDRKNENVRVYYGPFQTFSIPPQSPAQVIICNVQDSLSTASYVTVEQVTKGDGFVKIMTDGGSLIITLNKDIKISPWLTKNIVTIDDVKVGSRLIVWYSIVMESYPAQTTATKVQFLPNAKIPTGDVVISNNTNLLPNKANDKIKGELPKFTSVKDEVFTTKLNDIVKKAYDKAVEKFKATENIDLTFSYETKVFKNYTSVIIKNSINPGNTASSDVNTIVFNNLDYKIYNIKDFLGINAIELANDVASKAQNENKVYADIFTGFEDDPNFYLDETGKLMIIFDKYEFAPGYLGNVTLEIPIEKIVNKVIPIESTYMKDHERMVPLRQVAEGLGYEIKWNATSKMISIEIGANKHDILNGEIKEGVTYVPISFFETVVKGCYTVENSQITFSVIKY